jgi:hypothetical protein
MPVRARENPPSTPRARERAPGAGVFLLRTRWQREADCCKADAEDD